jgi:hypothetical protein
MQASLQPAIATDVFGRRSAQCRRLALGALPYQLVRELEALADEYDRRARAKPIVAKPQKRFAKLFGKIHTVFGAFL